MERTHIFKLLVITLLLSFIPIKLWAYSGGTGEPNDPYQIDTAEDLISLGNEPNDYNDCFILTADIDLASYRFERAVIAPDINDMSFLFQGVKFSGRFNGLGHVILNLDVNGVGYLGLFGVLDENSEIINLALENIDIHGVHDVGGIVGMNDGVITSSSSQGVVKVMGLAGGGLVGVNRGAIVSCSSRVQVNAGNWIGGLAGINRGCIIASSSDSSINGVECVGGLVGWNWGCVVSSYAVGDNYGSQTVGGLMGSNYGNVVACYSKGDVAGGRYVGGLLGRNHGTVVANYSMGAVHGNQYIGGLIAASDGNEVACFWDVEASGLEESSGGTGLTTEEIQNPSRLLQAEWDYVGEIDNGTNNYWDCEGDGYPSLAVFNGNNPIEPNGLGIPESPYVILDANELGGMWYRPMACYDLASDIDLYGQHWSVAVIPWFGGVLHGQNHMIRNLSINGGGYLGLMGQTTLNVAVANVGLDNINIVGSGNYVGALVGRNAGKLYSCYSVGRVRANESLGGLVGYNSGDVISSHSSCVVLGRGEVGGLAGMNAGSICTCYSEGAVSGDYYGEGGLVGDNAGEISSSFSLSSVNGYRFVGGLTGYSDGKITSCYARGGVTGDMFVGGLVGNNWNTVSYCHSSGFVNGSNYQGGLIGYGQSDLILSSFWDVHTSGQLEGYGGMSLTTAEMQDINIYLEKGWDFVDETANGTDDTWWMPENDYPRLWWESF